MQAEITFARFIIIIIIIIIMLSLSLSFHYRYHCHVILISCHLISDNSSGTERESLEKEIELGISLGGDKHPNIVNFLGHVSNFGKKIIVKSLPLERCLILNDPMDLG